MEKHFKTTFSSSRNSFNQIKLRKNSTNFDAKIETNSGKSDEVYYDEVIIYDGGGVDGYGY